MSVSRNSDSVGAVSEGSHVLGGNGAAVCSAIAEIGFVTRVVRLGTVVAHGAISNITGVGGDGLNIGARGPITVARGRRSSGGGG